MVDVRSWQFSLDLALRTASTSKRETRSCTFHRLTSPGATLVSRGVSSKFGLSVTNPSRIDGGFSIQYYCCGDVCDVNSGLAASTELWMKSYSIIWGSPE
ncbi:unnamed protein product [Phytophthora lilii]|uniref:Unnamed protein product n=1 Tax=Phytophthora lilii TaxID=2077276 RepID=A0A9W6WM75_9STRA|nr:unnamed protein product [Phytophthora lilii]